MTVTRIKIVSTQGGVTDTYVVESDYDALAARLAQAEWLLSEAATWVGVDDQQHRETTTDLDRRILAFLRAADREQTP